MAEIMLPLIGHDQIKSVATQHSFSVDDLKTLDILLLNHASSRDAVLALGEIDYRLLISGSASRVLHFIKSTILKMVSELDFTPSFDSNNRLIQQYPFINYDDYEIELTPYRVIITKVEKSKYWNEKPADEELKWLNAMYFFRNTSRGWERVSDRYTENYEKGMRATGIFD
jgi:hypothetical protein